MPRIARKNLNTSFLHVMVQGVNKEYIFEKDYYKRKYLEMINDIQKEYNFTMMAYCIMDNHAHFLIFTEDIEGFGKFMHQLNFSFATLYNKLENRVGVLFRNRYQAEPILNEKYLINCIKYIHDNPVKAGMVKRCKDYKYSSYNDYVYNTGIAKTEIVRKCFGENFDYLLETRNLFEKAFIDIEKTKDDNIASKSICNGIIEYLRLNKKSIVDIYSRRNIFEELIIFLKKEWDVTYLEISNFFEISTRTLQRMRN